MNNDMYQLNLDTRIVVLGKSEVMVQKINSMAIDSRCIFLKGDNCLALLDFLIFPKYYSEISQTFKLEKNDLSRVMMDLIKFDILSVVKHDSRN